MKSDPLTNRHTGDHLTINEIVAVRAPLERDRLMTALNQGLRSRLTLMVGPDGCGKSTLLHEWVERSPGVAVLVTADPTGCTPDKMLRKLVAALAHIKPEIAHEAPIEPVEPEVCMVELINALANHPNDIALVIDEYQPRPETDELLGFLLEYLPPQLHVYLAVEQAPTIPSLPRMRVRRQLNELTTRELLLTAEDVALLAERLGFELEPAEVEQLINTSHGCVGQLVTLLDDAAAANDPAAFLRDALVSPSPS